LDGSSRSCKKIKQIFCEKHRWLVKVDRAFVDWQRLIDWRWRCCEKWEIPYHSLMYNLDCETTKDFKGWFQKNGVLEALMEGDNSKC
jgi:hypothetical protein